jgi:hypothetical protein
MFKPIHYMWKTSQNNRKKKTSMKNASFMPHLFQQAER